MKLVFCGVEQSSKSEVCCRLAPLSHAGFSWVGTGGDRAGQSLSSLLRDLRLLVDDHLGH